MTGRPDRVTIDRRDRVMTDRHPVDLDMIDHMDQVRGHLFAR